MKHKNIFNSSLIILLFTFTIFSKNIYSQCIIPVEYQGNTGVNMTCLMLPSFIDGLTYQSDNPYLDFITDDVVESFCVLGEPEAHIEKLKVLESNGATQFNIYLDNGDEEKIIADYGEKIIPHF